MIKEDLVAAQIPYVDYAGLFEDFHALRHVTGSLLAKAGVHPKVSQSLMRHNDINLTMSRYTHKFRGQESEAVEKLPDLSLPSQKKQQALATGTDGKNDLSQNLSELAGQKRISTNLGELSVTNQDMKKNSFPTRNQRLQAKNEALIKRGRRDSNAQPSDRQSDALTS